MREHHVCAVNYSGAGAVPVADPLLGCGKQADGVGEGAVERQPAQDLGRAVVLPGIASVPRSQVSRATAYRSLVGAPGSQGMPGNR